MKSISFQRIRLKRASAKPRRITAMTLTCRLCAMLLALSVCSGFTQVLAADFTVSSNTDNALDPGYSQSLRYGLAQPGVGSLDFLLASSGNIISLSSGMLSVTRNLTLANNSSPSGITISLSGSSGTGIMNVASSATLSLGGSSQLKLTNSSPATQVYGLYSDGALNISRISSSTVISVSTGGSVAYAVYANDYAAINISDELTGTISATAGGGDAAGIGGSRTGSVNISCALAGSVSASADSSAKGISANGTINISSIASGGKISATTASNFANGISSGSSSISINLIAGSVSATAGLSGALGIDGFGVNLGAISSSGNISATAQNSYAYAIRSYNGVWIGGDLAGSLSARVINGSGAYGVSSLFHLTTGTLGPVTITGALTGSISATASANDASGIECAWDVSIGSIAGSGSISATAVSGNNAIGIYSNTQLSIGSIASGGRVSATAGGNTAYGLYGQSSLSISGDMAGTIQASAGGSTAAGIISFGSVSIGGALSGSVSASAGSGSTVYAIYSNNILSIGSIASGASLSATAGGSTAYGLYASGALGISGNLAGVILASAGSGQAAGLYSSTSVSIGGALSGSVSATVSNGSTAYAIFSLHDVSIGSIASGASLSASVSAAKAYGIYAEGNILITGGIAGSISAAAGTHTAIGIQALGNLNGGSASTPLVISGSVSAAANGLAVAVAAGGAMNLTVSGSLSGVDSSGGGNGYAIRAGQANGSGGWTDSSAVNILTLSSGARLNGKVDLGNGASNSLYLLGTGSADNYFRGVNALQVGDGSSSASWTLNPVAANASSYGSLTIKTSASLSINENVSINGNISDNGALTFNLGSDRTYSGVISGTGSLGKSGAATLNLTGSSSYSGGTILSGGTLAASTWASIGESTYSSTGLQHALSFSGGALTVAGVNVLSAGQILNTGTAVVSFDTASGDQSAAAALTGSGSVVKNGSGTLTLSGRNTYSGPTSLNAGTLSLTGTLSSSGVNIASGATFDFSPASDTTYPGTISGAGNFSKSGASTLTLSGAASYTGSTVVAGGILSVSNSLSSQSINISSGSALYLGASFTLSGTLVNNGTLSLPALTLASGSALSGSGTIFGDLTNSGGSISPGNSPGTLTINGNFAQSGGTLNMEVTPTAYDKLIVNGTASISGGTLAVSISPGYYQNGQSFTFISASGGISGGFSALSVSNQSIFLNFTITRNPSDVTGSFSITRASYASAATNRNSLGAALGLTQAAYVHSPLMSQVITALDFSPPGVASLALNQMSAEKYSALDETALSNLRLFSQTIRDRVYALRAKEGSPRAELSWIDLGRLPQLAATGGMPDVSPGLSVGKPEPEQNFGLYVKPIGQAQSFEKSLNRTGFQALTFGLLAGADAKLCDTLILGLQLGYARSDLRFFDNAGSRGKADYFSAGIYASFARNGWHAEAMLQSGLGLNSLNRKISFANLAREPSGKYNSWLFGTSLAAGYDFKLGDFKLGPLATLDYGLAINPGIREKGASDIGLKLAPSSANSLRSGLGARASAKFVINDKLTLTPEASLRWGHEFSNSSRRINSNFLGSPGTDFSSRTGNPARDALLLEAGATLNVKKRFKIFARYSGELFGTKQQTQAAAVGIRWEF